MPAAPYPETLMTTASSLQSRQLPRQPAQAPANRVVRSEPAALTSRQKSAKPSFAAEEDDEFRMNLSDLPRMSTGLHVDGFTPSLTSRVLDLLDRLRKRS
jgi:hypothetical protein